MAGYTVVMMLLLLIWFPETLHKDEKVESLSHLVGGYIKIATDLRFLSLIACVVFSYGAVIVFNIAGPFILQNKLGLSADVYGLYVLLVGLTYGISTFVNGLLLKYFKVMPLLWFGVIVTFLSGAVLFLFNGMGLFSVMTIIVATCVLQIGQGFVFANCLSSSLNSFSGLAGSVSSLFGSIVIIGVMVISAIAARSHIGAQLPLAIAYSGLGILTVISLIPAWLITRQEKV